MKTYAVGTYLTRITKAILLNTHNTCFQGEIRKKKKKKKKKKKTTSNYTLLSGAML